MITYKDKLVKLFHKLGAFKKGDFVLSSGLRSDFYIDARLVTLNNEGLHLICNMIDDILFNNKIMYDCVAAPIAGGVPIIGALIHRNRWNTKLNGCMIRTKAKQYGLGKQIEGNLGTKVVVVDDVVTTGESMIDSIEKLAEENVKVVAAISVVDRDQGAAELIAQTDVPYFSLLKVGDLR